MISSFTTVGRTGLDSLFIVYSVWVMLHLVVQTGLAHRHWRRTRNVAAWAGDWPAVTVVCPSYNEAPEDLRRCLQSLVDQDYEGRLDVHVVDDLSANRAEVMPVLDEFAGQPGWRIHLPERNGGKRAAQDLAVRDSGGELVLTIDSDTQLAPDAVRRLVLAFADEGLGAATGDVRVSNSRDNLLTRLIDLRYWVAFNQERASHALFGAVLCCSGPLSMYRRTVIDSGLGPVHGPDLPRRRMHLRRRPAPDQPGARNRDAHDIRARTRAASRVLRRRCVSTCASS